MDFGLKNSQRPRSRWWWAALLIAVLGLAAIDLGGRAEVSKQLIARPLLKFYRAGPARLNMSPCPSSPSCSVYAEQAIDRFGLVIGSMVAADRLIHEHSRLAEGPWIIDGRRLAVHDPLPPRLAWWDKQAEADQ